MKNYKLFRLVAYPLLIMFFLTACGSHVTTPTTATPELSTETTTGEISEYAMLGQMSLNFTGTFEGISFKLKEQPERIYNLHVASRDEAIELGIMSKDSQGHIQFEDIVGWKVEIVYEKNEEETGGYKVISFNGEAPPPTSADSGVIPTDTPTAFAEYTVHAGDSCVSIALTFNIPQESLIELNNLSADCSDLYLGQKLIIPTPVP